MGSNEVYCASHGDQKLLLRVYGSTAHGFFAREEEVRRSRTLGDLGFGPKVLHSFDEGRIEAWLDGQTPSNEAMRSPEGMRNIAKKLRSLHDKTGMNHNDLHRNNMLFMPDGRVEFLDFEYAGAADETFDIANHFNEWMYPYTGPEQHIPHQGLYPSRAQRREFCSQYLGETAGRGHVLDDFVEQVERRGQDSHAFWIAWAERTGPSDFNDLYAKARRKLLREERTLPDAHPVIENVQVGLGVLGSLLKPTKASLLEPAC